jgi:hypothetical protein
MPVPLVVREACAKRARTLRVSELVDAVTSLGFGEKDLPPGEAEKRVRNLTRGEQEALVETLDVEGEKLLAVVAEDEGFDDEAEEVKDFLVELIKEVQSRLEDLDLALEMNECKVRLFGVLCAVLFVLRLG